jgi:prevent-host-death family protein
MTMSSFNTTDARENLAEVLNRVAYAKERVRITRHGRDIAAVVPIEDLQLIERLGDEIDLREAKKALAEAGKKGSIPWDQVEKELGL